MLEYLQIEFSKTKWPFFRVIDLIEKGVFDRDEANRLFREGKIRKREGMHGDLIELINEEAH